jgi:enterochelin esterase-like enzyme
LYEVINLVAVYAGFPAALNGARVVQTEFQRPTMVPIGHQLRNIPAPSLVGNKFGESLVQPIYVYLPPSYSKSKKRYPVLYYLHGFGEEPGDFLQTHEVFDAFFRGSEKTEFIIVGVNGHNVFGGSFWKNSPATGNWEDFLVEDVVGYVDENFRTISLRQSRGLVGFSMGGSAALSVGMAHPDLFAAVSAFSPGLLAPDSLQNALSGWGNTFRIAYGAAFAPDMTSEKPFSSVPKFENTDIDRANIAAWESGFGGLDNRIDRYVSRPTRLDRIRITVGVNDHYRWIVDGCREFNRMLLNAGVENEFVRFDGGHEVPLDQVETGVLEFFSTQFESEAN